MEISVFANEPFVYDVYLQLSLCATVQKFNLLELKLTDVEQLLRYFN